MTARARDLMQPEVYGHAIEPVVDPRHPGLAQLPGWSAISGKNTSFHEAGATLTAPVLAMNAANFSTPWGITPKLACGSVVIFSRSSTVSEVCESST